MIDFENEINVNQEFEHVFDYLANPENLSVWNYAVDKVTLQSGYRAQEGSKYTVLRNMLGQVVDELIELKQVSHNKIFLQSIEGPFEYRIEYELQKLKENQTRIRNKMILKPAGFFRFFGHLAKNQIKNEVSNNLSVLKKVLEYR
ncbi:MAG: SRPBCC family protein [Bacillaceae bacterium]|nr:SRPBCC family protein [Bacillaceae bacterium]